MRYFLAGGLMFLAAVMATAHPATAQNYRIYTLVYDVPVNGRGEVDRLLSRSLTIFHAGKSYDYIEEAREVVVHEAARNQFTLLNTSRKIATLMHADEVRQLLKLAKVETETEITRLEREGQTDTIQAAALLRFQLAPKFQVERDIPKRKLVLSASNMRYEVLTADSAPKDVAESYSRYADSMCQLNHAIHRGVFPEPRLLLNAELRKAQVIPLEVTLQIDGKRSIRRKAVHRIHWQLDDRDRSLIHDWESMLKSPGTRKVDLEEYQRQLIDSQLSGPRR